MNMVEFWEFGKVVYLCATVCILDLIIIGSHLLGIS